MEHLVHRASEDQRGRKEFKVQRDRKDYRDPQGLIALWQDLKGQRVQRVRKAPRDLIVKLAQRSAHSTKRWQCKRCCSRCN